MAVVIELTDEQWSLVADLFDPPGRRGAPARIERRQMVSAMLFLARTGCQWRYLPDRFGPWGAAWQQWRRWRANGVWERAMSRLARHIRVRHERDPIPSTTRMATISEDPASAPVRAHGSVAAPDLGQGRK